MSTASISDFEISKRLGEGSFGSVYMVKRKSDGKIYAMKKVKMTSLSTKEKENALNEVRILASISSPNIISYKEAFYDEGSSSLCIIMDFASRGDVLMQITEQKKKKQYFEEKTIWRYAADMLLGLKALHNKKILHRDLKGANVFISEEGSLKLGDLNVSKVQKRDYAYTQTGTPYYTSPEVWQNRPYDSKCDVWSLGCVLYEITTLDPPFKGVSMEDLYKKVLRGVFAPISANRYSSDLQKFLESCLKVEPKNRASVDNLLCHKNILPHVDIDQIAKEDMNREFNKKDSHADLLQTIKLPMGGNLKGLNKQMPKSNYEKLAVEPEHQEAKSDQITKKKPSVIESNRPISAMPSVAQSPIQKQRDSSVNGNQDARNSPAAVGKQVVNEYHNRIISAPQVKRVLSQNDIGAGRNNIPLIPIDPRRYQQHGPSVQHPYNQPRIQVHQDKDTGYNNLPIRRSQSRDHIPSKQYPQQPSYLMKRPDGSSNQRPASNYHQIQSPPNSVKNSLMQKPPAGLPPRNIQRQN